MTEPRVWIVRPEETMDDVLLRVGDEWYPPGRLTFEYLWPERAWLVFNEAARLEKEVLHG